MDLTFGVTGAGKVGASFVKAFCAAGLRCAGIYGGAYADKKAKLLGVPLVTPGEMAQRADVIFICVPDRAIGEAAKNLAAEAVRSGIDVHGKFVYHVSGSAQCDVLAPLANCRALPRRAIVWQTSAWRWTAPPRRRLWQTIWRGLQVQFRLMFLLKKGRRTTRRRAFAATTP